MIDSASSTELGEPTVAQPLFAPSGLAQRPPLVRGSENIEPGGPGRHSTRGNTAVSTRAGTLPLVPTVSRTSNSGLGRGQFRVELLLRMRPCRRDRRGTRWQADPLKHMKIEPLLVGLEHLRSVKWACWSEKLADAQVKTCSGTMRHDSST